MFTPAEEEALRKQIQRFPDKMRVVNPRTSYSNEGASDLVANPARLPRITTATNEEPTLLAKTKHVRGKKETMGSFYARVGLGKSQILAMSKDEIAHFCEIASTHERPTAPKYTSIEQGIYELELFHSKPAIITVIG